MRERLVVEGEAREGDVAPDRLPLPPLIVAEASAAFLRHPVGEQSSPRVKVDLLPVRPGDRKFRMSFRLRGEKRKKCPLALASDLKNYTKSDSAYHRDGGNRWP